MKTTKNFFAIIIIFVSFVSNSFAQNGFTATLNTTMGTENRYGVELGYQYKDINIYVEGSYGSYNINNLSYNTPSVRVGADYSFMQVNKIQFFAGAFAGYTKFDGQDRKNAYIYTSSEADALTVGVRAGIKVMVGKHAFVRAAAQVTSTDFDRVMGISNSKGTHGKYDVGANLAVGFKF